MAIKAIEWMDPPTETKERKIMTAEQLQVPGLRMYGHHNTSHAIAALDLHYHKDCFEFTYIVDGNIRFSVDGRTYPLTGGDLYLTFPNEIHDTGSSPMSVHQMYWFQLEADDPDHFLFLDPATARQLLDMLYNLPARVFQLEVDETENILRSAFQYFRSGTPLGRIQGAQMVAFFLCRVVERSAQPSFRITPDIGRTMEYILEHLNEELSLEELSQIALLSVSRFKQKFKLQIGTSPRNFVNFHKVETAKKLLLDGKSVTDVAMELSFSSSNYFSSVFRRYTSYSPSQYLEAMAGAEKLQPAGEPGEPKELPAETSRREREE